MPPEVVETTHTEGCQVHGAPARSVNKTLLCMILGSLSLILWHVWAYGPSGHGAQAESSSASFPVLLGNELWDLLTNKHGILAELWDIFPYYLVGILLAGYLRTYKIAVKLQASLRKYGVMSVVIASLIGIITPLCACGTLTTAISLLFAGLPLAPVMSLLVTSPLMSPSTYLITLNDLGPEWTVIRTVAAFFMGIFAGLVTHFLKKRGFDKNDIFIEGAVVRGDFHDEDYPDERLRCNCRQKFGNRVAVKTDNKFIIFLAKSSEMLWLVGKYILVGVIIGSIVERYMPTEWLYRFFGRKDLFNIVWVTLCSVPIFLHQLSASSILYHIKSSLPGTLDNGAGLAFMVGGPVTAMPTMVMFWTIFKKRVFALYMFVCLAGTLLIAYTFQLFVFVPGIDMGSRLLKGIGNLSGGRSSVITKQHENVRIIMDPNGKAVVAAYANDMGKDGGIVFDAGSDRFRSDQFDNRQYVANVAAWLEQNNNCEAKGQVLVYDLSANHNSEQGPIGGNILASLELQGMKVKIAGRGAQPVLSPNVVNGYSQLWLFFDGTDSRSRLSDAEIKVVSEFVGTGKSILVVSGTPGTGGADDMASVNLLSSRYGVRFADIADNGARIHVSTLSPLLNSASGVLGKILKFFHKA